MISNAMRAFARPFNSSEVSTRIGNSYTNSENQARAIALLYIERQTAQKRLDDVCAEFGYSWNSEKEVVLAEPQRIVIKTTLTLRSSDAQEVITRSEYGEATGDATKTELFKSASSDSFKRCASEYGIGRYLYAVPNTWFELENRYRFRNSEEYIVSSLYRKMGLDEYVDFVEFSSPSPAVTSSATETALNTATDMLVFAERKSKSTDDRPAEPQSQHRDAVELDERTQAALTSEKLSTEKFATEKQVGLITKLISLKNLYDTDRASYETRLAAGLSKKEASQIIDELQGK